MNAASRLLQLHGVIVDLIYHVDAVPQAGDEAIVRNFTMAAGGGFNAMASATRSGLSVSYAGGIGTGPLGNLVCDALAAENLEHLQPRDENRDQGCCTVMIDRSGERTFVASEGAEGHVNPADLRRIHLPDYRWSLLSGYTLFYPGSVEALTHWLCSDAPIPNLVFDPAPIIGSVRTDAIKAVMARAAWISANITEAEFLTGESDPAVAVRHLAEGRSGGAVVRIGEGGCIVAWDGQVHCVPGHKVAAVDTNGAGDAHIGAFIAALSRGDGPVEAARYANVAAALSTTRYGPATAPDFATIEETLRSAITSYSNSKVIHPNA